jgi:hypothetical protein
MKKACSTCKVEKDVSEFCKDRSAKDGYQYKCKACFKLKYKENRDKLLEYGKEHYKQNRDKLLEYQKQYNEKNIAKISEYAKEYYKEYYKKH